MKQDVKEIWTNALRSGEYKQGKGYLVNTYVDAPTNPAEPVGYKEAGHCCLGVLCEEAVKHGATDSKGNLIERRFAFGDVAFGTAEEFEENEQSHAFLPKSVQEWAGLDSENPVLMSEPCDHDAPEPSDHTEDYTASHVNDEQLGDFNRIADLIDKVL